MSDNPFADAIKPRERPAITRTVEPPPFFQAAIEGERLKREARNMTRQDMFNNGLLTVEDMDDEELRAGRMRGPDGKIPRVNKTMEMVPRDIYEAMVLEHQTRTQDKFRQQLDMALNTIVGIMTDPTAEPKDRLDAAKYIKEQVMGKTPDRVQVQVAKAPWEEMMGDFANISRERQARLEAGYIDADVVEDSTNQEQAMEGARLDGQEATAQQAPPPLEDSALAPHVRYAEPAPSHDNPVTTHYIPKPPTNSEIIAAERCDMIELAARRAEAKQRIQAAKKRRIIARTMGTDALEAHKITTTEVPDADDPTTGKLRHTLS